MTPELEAEINDASNCTSICDGCLAYIPFDEERYINRGNWCDKCLEKINAKLDKSVEKKKYAQSLRVIRGDDSGIES